MTALSRVLWTITGGVLAAAAGLLVYRLMAVDVLYAALIGAVVFLVFMQFLANADWRAERRSMEHRMMALHADYQDATAAVEDVRGDMENLRHSLAAEGRTSESELVAELKVLQTLLSQVVSNSARPRSARPARRTVSVGETASEYGEVYEQAAVWQMEAADNDPRADVLEIMHHALEENRIDLYLQPVVRLPSRKTVSYEAVSRVRDDKGRLIYPRQYLPVVEESGLIGTLDNLLLFRCIQLVRRLGVRRPGVKFFCNISSMSLNDTDFFAQFIDFMSNNADLRDRLVFEFAQADVDQHSDDVARGLAILGRRGFRFSMDQVQDLNLDAASLAARHFSFVKVPVQLFLTREGHVERGDLAAVMARHDIDLIVHMIEDEQAVIEVLECGVEYGQGFLFGEPRPSRDDWVDRNAAEDAGSPEDHAPSGS